MPEELKFSTKAMPGQLTVDEAEGIVEAFVAGIGNKDSVGDIVLPGAFSASLKRRKPRVVWGHNWNEPIGKVLDIYEVGPDDPRLPKKMKDARIGGLFARVQFNLKSERGREAFANIAFFGMEQEWSIGYKTITAAYDNSRQANLLREVELYEVSPVLHGANQLTGTISIKSDNPEDRVSSFKKSKWPMFDRQFAEMIKEEHPKIWDAGGNIKGDDQYTILTKIAEQGGVAQTEDQIKALELREAWVARHEKDHRLPGVIAQIKWLAIGSRGEGHMKDIVREVISKENMSEKAEASCPIATRDIAVNIKNRQKAIEDASYGPLNPELPNNKYWAARADRWDVTPDEARKQKCGNCAAFLQTPRILDCIKQGLGNETGNDAMDVIDAGDLGYCEAFDFKCASARTCDAWVVGGPIAVEKNQSEKTHSYWNESDDEDPMEELGRIAESMRVQNDESDDNAEEQSNDAMGRSAVLARSLANELRAPVRIRTITGNTVVFDVMDESDEPTTMRASWHAENGQVMIGRPEKVRIETVYIPETGSSEGDAYMGDESMKAATDRVPTGTNLIPDAIPQERFTGDVLRGRGPRRGNLERLLRYWRPIMRREGGFRRCLVILADHPELYPLQNLCAWLHHETTGLWPNEGCHHPGMKNCRRKLRGVVRGSLVSDSDFNRRMNELKPDTTPNGKSMPDPFEWDSEKGDMGMVTEDDIQHAYKVMNWFAGEEKDFMEFLIDDKNWQHQGEDEDGNWYEHEWVQPTNAPSSIAGKPGGCGCGCSGKGACTPDLPKSISDSISDLEVKVGRVLNARNTSKITQAIQLLTDVIGDGPSVALEQKENDLLLKADSTDLLDLQAVIGPVVDFYGLETEFDDQGMWVKGADSDAYDALSNAVHNFDFIETKSDLD
jgi:HK97 family phage prohead protease